MSETRLNNGSHVHYLKQDFIPGSSGTSISKTRLKSGSHVHYLTLDLE